MASCAEMTRDFYCYCCYATLPTSDHMQSADRLRHLVGYWRRSPDNHHVSPGDVLGRCLTPGFCSAVRNRNSRLEFGAPPTTSSFVWPDRRITSSISMIAVRLSSPPQMSQCLTATSMTVLPSRFAFSRQAACGTCERWLRGLLSPLGATSLGRYAPC